MSKSFKAMLTFLAEHEGGFLRPPETGIRPQLALGNILTSCVVRTTDKTLIFPVGTETEVSLELLFWDEYGKYFKDGMDIVLRDGSRIVAHGRFISEN